MKHKMILSAILIATLALCAFAASPSPGTQTTQKDKQEQKRKAEHEERDDEENDAESESAKEQARLAKQAKLTMEQAREIALKRAPGTVESGELEREHGKLVYSFDIRNDAGTITEVQVDARDGSVVSVEEEDAQKEADEKRKEKQEPTHHKRP